MERTVQDIDREIAALEAKYNEVEGTQTEVYTRIVGYFRSVANWNKGKREEYNYRKTFELNDKQIKQRMAAVTDKEEPRHVAADESNSVPQGKPVSYKLFHSQFCRNCPPVVRFMNNVDMDGEMLDVTGDIGVEQAKQYGVKSTPTVLLFDENNNVVKEMHTVEELQSVFGTKIQNVAV